MKYVYAANGYVRRRADRGRGYRGIISDPFPLGNNYKSGERSDRLAPLTFLFFRVLSSFSDFLSQPRHRCRSRMRFEYCLTTAISACVFNFNADRRCCFVFLFFPLYLMAHCANELVIVIIFNNYIRRVDALMYEALTQYKIW